MMRRRLFWKLFLAFWLANCLTFLVGAGAFMLNDWRGDTPALRSLLATELQLLQRYGEQAGRNCWRCHRSRRMCEWAYMTARASCWRAGRCRCRVSSRR